MRFIDHSQWLRADLLTPFDLQREARRQRESFDRNFLWKMHEWESQMRRWGTPQKRSRYFWNDAQPESAWLHCNEGNESVLDLRHESARHLIFAKGCYAQIDQATYEKWCQELPTEVPAGEFPDRLPRKMRRAIEFNLAMRILNPLVIRCRKLPDPRRGRMVDFSQGIVLMGSLTGRKGQVYHFVVAQLTSDVVREVTRPACGPKNQYSWALTLRRDWQPGDISPLKWL